MQEITELAVNLLILLCRRLLVWHEGVNFGIVRDNGNKLYKQMDHASALSFTALFRRWISASISIVSSDSSSLNKLLLARISRSVLVREHHLCLLENKRYLNRGVENWTKSKSEEHAEALWKSQRRSLRKCRTWSLIPWLWRDVNKLWILKLNFKVSQHLTNMWTRNDNRETVSPEPVFHL